MGIIAESARPKWLLNFHVDFRANNLIIYSGNSTLFQPLADKNGGLGSSEFKSKRKRGKRQKGKRERGKRQKGKRQRDGRVWMGGEDAGRERGERRESSYDYKEERESGWGGAQWKLDARTHQVHIN
ncbi:unnamed protein product [Prunus armeniaca]